VNILYAVNVFGELKMEKKAYFTFHEWIIIILLALISALINSYIPIKEITLHIGIPGPAAGMALFGGFIFVLWISLALNIVKKKLSGIITSIFIASFCLLIHPWYGIVSPSWFSVYAIFALLSMGIIIELFNFYFYSLKTLFSGGVSNLSCLIITWLAIGIHTNRWIPYKYGIFLVFIAFISGNIGLLLSNHIKNFIVRSVY